VVIVERRFCMMFGRELPTKMSFYKWYKLFDQTGYICKEKSPRRRPVTEAQVETFRAAFVCSTRKSTRHATRQLNMPHTTVHTNLRKCLKFKRYKNQLFQHITAQDKKFATHFALTFFQDLKMINFLKLKLSSAMKTHSIYREMLIDIT
jgi:hypothetical protein